MSLRSEFKKDLNCYLLVVLHLELSTNILIFEERKVGVEEGGREGEREK